MASCACLLLLGGQVHEGHGATLSSLLAGGTLDVGNSRLSQWQLLGLDATAAPIPDMSQIMVNALATSPSQPSIQFVAGSQLATSGINAIELELRYRVDAVAGTNTFTQQVLEIGSLTWGGSSEISQISSQISDGVISDLGATIVYADNGANITQLTDTEAFAPKSRMLVTTNLFIAGLASGDSTTLGGYVQRFLQNGPTAKPGDYNQNGTVDAADYTVWRNRVGAPAESLANDTAGGTIGTAQYNLWKSNFGIPGSGSAILLGTAVPEPATGLTLFGAALGGWLSRRRRSSAI